MFEKAARLRLRFDYKGSCTPEDLWDVPLVDLDGMFRELNSELKESKSESLLEVNNSIVVTTLELKVGLITKVVKTRQGEIAVQAAAQETKAQKQKILAILADKQDEALKGKSYAAV